MKRACDNIRLDLLAHLPLGERVRAHLGDCAPCRLFAARLAIVDDGLEADAVSAAARGIPSALRARILAAAFPAVRVGARASTAATATGTARALDLGLRVAAVAAVIIATIAVVPGAAQADEVRLVGLAPFAGAMSQPLTGSLVPRAITLPATDASIGIEIGAAGLPLTIAAVVLLASGILLRRR